METMIEYAGRLEREHAAMKAKINEAVRDLDALIVRAGYLVRNGGMAQELLLSGLKELRKELRS